MYKAALLGCGKRTEAHAQAYASIRRASLVAACSRNAERLQAFSDQFGIQARYRGLAEMLEREKPDLLHIVTAPRGRIEAMKIASDLNVPAVLIEKPIALEGEDYRQVADLVQRSKTRFAVNTQLHYHPANARLRDIVAQGAIGDIRMIEASARSTMVNQGPHVLQLVTGYNAARPRRVFAQVSGSQYLDDPREPSPDNVLATIELDGGARVLLTVGEQVAPLASDHPSRFFHKQIVVHGSRGYVRWWMSGWESFTESAGYQRGSHEYIEQNDQAQIALTEAMLDWLGDARKQPAVNLQQADREFNTLLGVYVSALRRQPIDLPVDPPNNLLAELRRMLTPVAQAS